MHFYFDDTSTSAISTYSHTLSLHGALPIAALVSELRGLQVDTGSILYGGERLGIYFLETGSVSRASKVIYDRAHSSISTIEPRSEEHTSELQSLMRLSYAVFCLKTQKFDHETTYKSNTTQKYTRPNH